MKSIFSQTQPFKIALLHRVSKPSNILETSTCLHYLTDHNLSSRHFLTENSFAQFSHDPFEEIRFSLGARASSIYLLSSRRVRLPRNHRLRAQFFDKPLDVSSWTPPNWHERHKMSEILEIFIIYEKVVRHICGVCTEWKTTSDLGYHR